MATLADFVTHAETQALASGFKKFHFGVLQESNWKNLTAEEWPLFLLVIPDSTFTLQELLNDNAQQNYNFTILYLDTYRDESKRKDKIVSVDNKFIAAIKAIFGEDYQLKYAPTNEFTVERFIDVGTNKAIGGSTSITVNINETC